MVGEGPVEVLGLTTSLGRLALLLEMRLAQVVLFGLQLGRARLEQVVRLGDVLERLVQSSAVAGTTRRVLCAKTIAGADAVAVVDKLAVDCRADVALGYHDRLPRHR